MQTHCHVHGLDEFLSLSSLEWQFRFENDLNTGASKLFTIDTRSASGDGSVFW